MSTIYWRSDQGISNDVITESHPLPVQIRQPADAAVVPVAGKLWELEPTAVPGVATGAFTADDAFGTVFSVAVPRAGAIVRATFTDLDDEGLSKELWIGVYEFTGAADHDPFTIADSSISAIRSVMTFQNFKDAVSGQVAESNDVPVWYYTPMERLWFQFKTLGTDDIAANSVPRLSLLIEEYT